MLVRIFAPRGRRHVGAPCPMGVLLLLRAVLQPICTLPVTQRRCHTTGRWPGSMAKPLRLRVSASLTSGRLRDTPLKSLGKASEPTLRSSEHSGGNHSTCVGQGIGANEAGKRDADKHCNVS
eukprot:scaffold8175_cov578-Prasinococcus_capsulatus_cf.AAC.3